MFTSAPDSAAVSTQLEMQARSLGDQIKNAGHRLKHVGDFEFEITGGAHVDTTLNLKAGNITVGNDSSNDIVLFADDVAPTHVEVELPDKIFGKIKVTPIDEAISFGDGDIVAVGQYAEINSGDEIHIGGASFRVSRMINVSRAKPYMFKGIAIIAFLLMLPLLSTLFSGLVSSAFNSSYKIASSVGSGIINSNILETKPISDVPSNPEISNLTDKFVWAVKVKLEDLELAHKVTVSAMDNGSIKIRGTISDEDNVKWNSFLYWYDQRKGFPAAIRDVKRDTNSSNFPKVKSIWLEDPATVFFQDGTSATIGEKLWYDWVVVEITRTGIVLERDGSKLSLGL